MVIRNPQNNVANGLVISWLHHLCPDLTKDKWTQEDNKKLLELQKSFGSKWKEIAGHFPHRTDNGIKNQFFSIVRKSLRKACKASGINIGSNIINEVKPKILSDFLNMPIKGNSKSLKTENGEVFKMRDFIQRFAFCKMNEIKTNFDIEDRPLIYDTMNKMQLMKLNKQPKLH